MFKVEKKMVSMRLSSDVLSELKELSDDLGSSQGELVDTLVRCLWYHKGNNYKELGQEINIDGLHRSFNSLLGICRVVYESKSRKEAVGEGSK